MRRFNKEEGGDRHNLGMKHDASRERLYGSYGWWDEIDGSRVRGMGYRYTGFGRYHDDDMLLERCVKYVFEKG